MEVKALVKHEKYVKQNVSRQGECFTPRVKTWAGLTPEENMHAGKLGKVKRTAYLYANANPKLIDEGMGWRIDLIAIDINSSTHCAIDARHYENI